MTCLCNVRAMAAAFTAVLASLSCSLFMFASPAVASACVSAPDGGATLCYDSDMNKLRLTDAKCDGNSVYAKYKVNGGREETLANDRGCLTDELDAIDGTGSIVYTVCTQYDSPFQGDSCSGWREDSL